MKTVLKAKTIRLYPNSEQKMCIAKTCGCARFVYDQMLYMQEQRHKNEPDAKYVSAYGMNYLLTQLKQENHFLYEVDSTSLISANDDLNNGYQRFFKGLGKHPRFKSKHNHEQSYTSKSVNNNIRVLDEHHIRIPKLGSVYFKSGAMPVGRIKSITVRMKASGRYVASVLFETEIDELPCTGKEIGIDMGLHDLMILSDGTKYDCVRFDKRDEEKLRYWQRLASRRLLKAKRAIENDKLIAKTEPDHVIRTLDDFKNYQKARRMVAKYHEHIANCRNDYLQKVSTALLREYDVIAIEDLRTNGMLHNHKLARAVENASWRAFRTMLEYKCDWYGKALYVVNPAYTSQMCHTCGCVNNRLGYDHFGWLKVREWNCPECGAHLDRDINAAQNILATALQKKAISLPMAK
jgi:putative transposase